MSPKTSTTCPYCGVGCGVVVTRGTDDSFKVAGDLDHPANYGRLCSKGAALADTLGLEDRLLYPEVNGQRTDWDTALTAVADGFQNTISQYGPDSVAFYVSGQLLTEDYYVANKLMKGFIGSGNIDTNSRLCMSSAVAGHKRAFGSDTVPCDYTDLETAELIVIVGSNLAWCHPVLWQRLGKAREQHPERKLVVIDPRRTNTAAAADLHLAIEPGTDTLLFNGLLNYLRQEDVVDWRYLEQHTEGFADALASAKRSAATLPQVARACGLDDDMLARFCAWFARTENTVTLYSQGVNQSSCGTDKVNSIINCHLATGRIGKPGQGPFSITGQPNAMGGREVGGLANTLAAHMDFDPQSVDRVARFWQSPQIATRPGLKAVELFTAIERGEVKAVWIMATNPVVSLPDADRMRTALRQCELVVVSDCVSATDTLDCAHIKLPAAGWGEKDGTVTNSERRISRQRAFCAPPGEAQPDWWIVNQVAQRMGHREAFAYGSVDEIFREHAALSCFENGGQRDFDIGALTLLTAEQYLELKPVQWPLPAPQQKQVRLFADRRFYTASRKARLVPIDPRPPEHPLSNQYPLVLNTGRVRDQWHTMTRTARAARLNGHTPEPMVQIHPEDARKYGVINGKLATIESRWGSVVVRVVVSDAQRQQSVFVPIHWNDQFASKARIDTVVNPVVDPISGEPEFKHTPVRISPYAAQWYGFLLSRRRVPLSGLSYWVQVKEKACWRHEFADLQDKDWRAWFNELSNADETPLEYADARAGRYRFVSMTEQRLDTCLFVARSAQLPPRAWLVRLFEQTTLTPDDRLGLLAGTPLEPGMDIGAIVCSCFGVGRNTLMDAIRSNKLNTVAEIGTALQAGTNCGSCKPELQALLSQHGSSNTD